MRPGAEGTVGSGALRLLRSLKPPVAARPGHLLCPGHPKIRPGSCRGTLTKQPPDFRGAPGFREVVSSAFQTHRESGLSSVGFTHPTRSGRGPGDARPSLRLERELQV